MNICVYGGASGEVDPAFITAGEKLGEAMARRGHGLVFGGGANGLMGAAARGERKHDGCVISIVPSFFNVDGVLFEDDTERIYTETMRERKQLLEERSDAFVMTPGGIGTFDEFFEILTLRHLERHVKPIAVLNTNGYYEPLRKMMQNAVDAGFLAASTMALCPLFEKEEELLDYLESQVQG